MRRGRLVATVVLSSTLALAFLAACQPSENKKDPEVVRLGFLGPFSKGNIYRSLGHPAERAAQITVDQLNQSGGIELNGRKRPIEIIISDTLNRPEMAIEQARELINKHHVVALLGPLLSRTALAVAPLAESQQIPMISPTATHSRLTQGRSYVFQMSPSDDIQGLLLARFLFSDLGIRRAAILYDTASDYNKNIAEIFQHHFRKLDGQVVASETYTTGEKDFRPQLTRIRQQAAEALFLPNYADDVPLQAKQARELDLAAILVGSDTWDRRTFPDLEQFEGSYFLDFWQQQISAEEERLFGEEFLSTHGGRLNTAAALTRDAIGILVQAIETAGSTEGPALRRTLIEMGPYSGISGTISFGKGGEPMKALPVLSIRGGRLNTYGWLSIDQPYPIETP